MSMHALDMVRSDITDQDNGRIQSGASSAVIQEAPNVKRGARAKTMSKAKARAKITTKNKLQQSINCPPDSKCVIAQ